MICYKAHKISDCPVCGGQPTIQPEHWENAYSSTCEKRCGFPKITHVEATPGAAMEMWEREVNKYLELRTIIPSYGTKALTSWNHI